MSGKEGGVDMMRAKRGVGSRLGRWGDGRGQEGHIDKGVWVVLFVRYSRRDCRAKDTINLQVMLLFIFPEEGGGVAEFGFRFPGVLSGGISFP